MYDRLTEKLTEDLTKEQQVECIKDVLKEFAMYSEEDIPQFILHNSMYSIGFNIDVICLDFNDIWNNTIIYVSFISPDCNE